MKRRIEQPDLSILRGLCHEWCSGGGRANIEPINNHESIPKEHFYASKQKWFCFVLVKFGGRNV